MGPKAGLDALAMRKHPNVVPAGNQCYTKLRR